MANPRQQGLKPEEGGYVNHADDPGKETNFGISSRTYPGLKIRELTLSDAVDIYRRDYWQPIQGVMFPDPLALVLLDTAVNMGPTAAILMLQKPAFACLKDYEAQLAKGLDPVFHPEKLGIKNADYWIENRAEVNLMREQTGHPFEADPDTVAK